MKRVTEKTLVALQINGETRNVIIRPSDLLLDTMRGQLGLTGAKPGCKNGDCGACTVLMDGWPVKSCLLLTVEAEGHALTTVEGLPKDSAIQQAFINADAFQCGYCTSGFLMVCHALLTHHPQTDEGTMEAWLQSNLCRCTSYAEIREAVRSVLSTTTTAEDGGKG